MFKDTKEEKEIAKRLFLNELKDGRNFPKYIELETIRACNARCVMCTINEWEKSEAPKMSDELFDKFVKEVANYSEWIEVITLNKDGEPTLDRKLPKKIKALKDVGIKSVKFTTNGEKLDENFAKEVLEAGVDEVMFSIDSIKKEVYESVRIGLDFDKVMHNTLAFIELKNKLRPKSKMTLRMVEMKETSLDKESWIAFWNSKLSTNDSAYVMPMHTWGNQLLDEVNEKVNFYKDKICISPFSSFVIHADGKIGMCAIDFNSKYKMGNFSNTTIKHIWKNEKFDNLRVAHLSGSRNSYEICKGCDIWDRSYENKK